MPNFGTAGVNTTEQLTALSPSATASNFIAGFVGEHWRGPTTPYFCSSWAQFTQVYGGFNPNINPVLANPYLASAVFEYFCNGGQTALIGRITSSMTPGTNASLNFADSAATPQVTLELVTGRLGQSGNVGTWGNNIYADINNRGGVGSGRFDLVLYYGGYGPGYIVETWTDMSMNVNDPRYALTILNSPINGSLWVVAANLNDPTASPFNCPATVTNQQFSGGTDSGDPSVDDRIAGVTVGSSVFDAFEGALTFAMPGENTLSVLSAAINYAQTRPQSFFVFDPPPNQTYEGAISFFDSVAPISQNACMYYPWLIAQNPASSSLQATTALPPSGFVVGRMISTDSQIGPWQSPAGVNSALANVVQAQGGSLLRYQTDALYNANVNPLRTLPNGQVVLWGDVTMETSYQTQFITIRRTLNFIEASLVQILQFALFQPNTSTLWAQILTQLNQYLGGLYSRGAFAGNTPGGSYYIICNASNNTPQSIAQGVVNTTVGVALASPAEYINLLIQQFQTTGSTVVSQVAA